MSYPIVNVKTHDGLILRIIPIPNKCIGVTLT